jgi:4-hydroxy-tetrahydrodipicolinate reductase
MTLRKCRVAVAGASGRMGRMLIEATLNDEGVVLAGAFDRPGTGFIGRDAGEFTGTPCGVRSWTTHAARLPRPIA